MHPHVSESKKHTARSTRLPSQRIILVATLFCCLAGCAGPGAVAPHPPADTRSKHEAEDGNEVEWSGGQLERLERLRRALSEPPQDASGLTVRLAFDGAVDLDLFVTDPLQESVYFANSPSKTGGRLLIDRRCGDLDLRVETVHFTAPPSGVYRIGVDFHKRCDESEYSGSEQKQGIYHVRADRGAKSWIREGLLVPGRFEMIVLEVEVEAKVEGAGTGPTGH
jgi:hypothetical protein